MPSPGIAAGSFFLGGQLQGQQLAQQLAQQQALQTQMELAKFALEQRRAESEGKQLVKQPDGTWKVVDLETMQAGTTIGDSIDYGARLKDMISRGGMPASLRSFAEGAIASGDKGYQQNIYNSAIKLAGSPSYYKVNLSPAEQQQAIAEALPYAPPEIRGLLQQAVQPGAPPALIDFAYKKVLPPAFGSGMYAPHYFNVQNIEPGGASTITPWGTRGRGGPAYPVIAGGGGGGAGAVAPMNDPGAAGGGPSPDSGSPVGVGRPPGFGGGAGPASGPISSASSAGGPMPGRPLTSVKLGQKEQALVSQIQSLIPQLKDRLRELQALGPDKWNRGSEAERYLDYRKQKNMKIAPSDPELAALLPQMIAAEAGANAALGAAAGTKAVRYFEHYEGHMPSAYGDYNYNINAIKGLLSPNGPYLPTLREFGIKPAEAAPESGSSGGVPSGMKDLGGGYFYNPKTNEYFRAP